MMDPALKQKIETYVTTKFNAEQQNIYEDARLKAAELPRLGVGNAAYSTYADDRHIRIQSECTKALVLKRAEIHIEADEIYDVTLDSAIVEDARMLRDMVVAGRSSAVAGQLDLEVMRNVKGNEHSKAIAESFKRQLTIQTHNVVGEVFCMVEKARVAQSKKRESLPNITVQGDNARVNINSVDASHNESKR